MTKKFNVLLSILITMAVVLIMGTAASYAATKVNYATAYVNSATGVNLRSSASIPKKNSTSNIITGLNDNTKLTVKRVIFKTKDSTAASKKWYEVSANGVSGYIRADNVDGLKYSAVDAKVTKKVTYRKGAGTKMNPVGTLNKGTRVQVLLKATPVSSTKGSNSTWYMIKYNNKKYYACSTYFRLIDSHKPAPTPTPTPTPTSDEEFKADLEKQGFDNTYVDKLMELHKLHSNWNFEIKKLSVTWEDAVGTETRGNTSLIQRSGSSAWVKANEKEVAYYLDPRNFLNEKNVFMFENLSYNSKYQTADVIDTILSGTGLEKYGFDSEMFINAGANNNISPVHLASRARQETGGKINGDYSPAITGKPYSPDEDKYEKKTVYNPFNIDATSSVTTGLEYAYEHGWFTKEKAVNESAKLLAEDYINNSKYHQNTIYFQKFNIANNVATHQYMQNIKSPYMESVTVYNSYNSNGVINKAFTFIIPVYKSMPKSTPAP